jgi:sensor histidine kinase YesM
MQKTLLYRRWPWHLLFWFGYALFRFWVYYITVMSYNRAFLEYMLLTDVMFAGFTYYNLWLYRKLFTHKKYATYFVVGAASWLLFLWGRTVFQFYYLQDEPRFQYSFTNMFLNNITFVIVYFLFLTTCKYFKDGYISQQFEAERKQQQLMAEVNNLKSQIAPHFLFNTLNNLYGLAVEKSDKLPDLMLRMSELLRHSLYETQKPLVPVNEEINVLKSYIKLESLRLEDDLKLHFVNTIPEDAPYQIAPLILIVFMENAFKHAKHVPSEPIHIAVKMTLDDGWFSLIIRNNYNKNRKESAIGIGLNNVKRRLEVLYPNQQHQLTIIKDDLFSIYLQLQLQKTA